MSSHPRPKTITGNVIDDDTKLPVVASLTINVSGFSPVESSTDSLGKFSVAIPEAAQCTIVVKAPGFDAQEETVTISESDANYIEIHLTPSVKVTLGGTVFGGTPNSEQPLDAKLTVYLNSDFVKKDSVMIWSGNYSESFTDFGWYIVNFSAPGYADVRDTIWVMNTHRKNIHKDYHLVPLDSKLSIALTNIHFKFGSSTLESDAYVELDYLGNFLNHNLSKQVEITGHTDNSGPVEYNLLLSQARAQSVVNYLSAKGVKSDQLITIGYGQQKPVDSNTTAIGKANNRRVELVLSDKPAAPEITVSSLGNIHFDFGTANVRIDSHAELNLLVEFCISNRSTRVEVDGHADSSGPEDFNDLLALARAQAVVNYLKSKGVNGYQLFAKGYGETRPIDSNLTAVGKANNRRVELILLTKDDVRSSVKN